MYFFSFHSADCCHVCLLASLVSQCLSILHFGNPNTVENTSLLKSLLSCNSLLSANLLLTAPSCYPGLLCLGLLLLRSYFPGLLLPELPTRTISPCSNKVHRIISPSSTFNTLSPSVSPSLSVTLLVGKNCKTFGVEFCNIPLISVSGKTLPIQQFSYHMAFPPKRLTLELPAWGGGPLSALGAARQH